MNRRVRVVLVVCVVLAIAAIAAALLSNADRLLALPLLRPLSLRLCQPSPDLYYLTYGPPGPDEFTEITETGINFYTNGDYRPGNKEIWRVDRQGIEQRAGIEQGRPKYWVAKSVGGKFLAYNADAQDPAPFEELVVACGDGARPFTLVVAPKGHDLMWVKWLNADTLYYEDWASAPHMPVRHVVHNVLTGDIQEMGPVHNPIEYQWNPRDPFIVSYLQASPDFFWLWDRRSGRRTPITFVPEEGEITDGNDYRPSRWSLDGRYLAFSLNLRDRTDDDRDGEVLLYDRETGVVKRLTHFWNPDIKTFTYALRWSPDGHWIAFVLDQAYRSGTWLGPSTLYVISVDGRELIDLGLEFAGSGSLGSKYAWSPDSREIAFTPYKRDNNIFAVSIATRAIRRLTNKPSTIRTR